MNGEKHFDHITTGGLDGVIFTAESFSTDLEKLLDKTFTQVAPGNKTIEMNIISWWTKHTESGWEIKQIVNIVC